MAESSLIRLTARSPSPAAAVAGQSSDDADRRDQFAHFVAEHEQQVTRLVHRLLGWRPDAEDVVQDVFVKAWSGWNRFRGESRPGTWLTRIAINTCRAHLRRKMLTRRLFSLLGRTSARSSEDRPSGADAPEHGSVREAVRRLPRAQREVVVLYYLEELPVREIATVLEISANAVEARLFRARLRLRQDLTSAGIDV